ncbi:hypothetical protein ABT160_00665 [Streptomyces sp. NPDC001941]|uniref:hypothetical protein n=1 Tax=Streptomyces sp. NPDC001941 TaxID=3154659 RepID=UPI00331FE4D8
MRTRTRRAAAVAAAVSALLTASACTGDSGEGQKKPAASPSAADGKDGGASAGGAALTAAQLTAATLEVKDLPAGWKGDKAEATTAGARADKAECQPLAELINRKVTGATMGPDAAFAGQGGNALLNQRVFTFPGAGAAEFTKSIGTSLDTCKGFTASIQGGRAEVTVEKLTAAPTGTEETHAFRLKMKLPELGGITMEMDNAVLRQGSGVTSVSFLPANAAGHPAFADLLKRAAAKFTQGAGS